MTTTLYTSPGCGPCKLADNLLTRRGIDHDIVDVTTLVPGDLAELRTLGIQTPIIVQGETVIVGFVPAKIMGLTNA
jgi:glutaredoxin-like protein NrdH